MTVRQQKVAALIQRLVGMSLVRDLTDPRTTGLLTVTKVEVTPDLREARVYVSVLAAGGGAPAATALQGLKSATRHIQAQVASSLSMRNVPRLQFFLDESLKKQAAVLQQLDKVAAERVARGDDKRFSDDDTAAR